MATEPTEIVVTSAGAADGAAPDAVTPVSPLQGPERLEGLQDENRPVTPGPGPSATALGKHKQPRSPSLERHEQAAMEAMKRRLK